MFFDSLCIYIHCGDDSNSQRGRRPDVQALAEKNGTISTRSQRTPPKLQEAEQRDLVLQIGRRDVTLLFDLFVLLLILLRF